MTDKLEHTYLAYTDHYGQLHEAKEFQLAMDSFHDSFRSVKCAFVESTM